MKNWRQKKVKTFFFRTKGNGKCCLIVLKQVKKRNWISFNQGYKNSNQVGIGLKTKVN